MADRMRGLFWPTVLSLFALAVLVGLGTWQMRRLQWKNGLIAQIESRTHAAPVPFADALAAVRRGEDLEYTRVSVTGRWLRGLERYLWAPGGEGQGQGWHVYAPLKTDAGPIVIVNRGFVTPERRDPASRPEPGQAGEVSLVGLLRKPEARNAFTPDNDVGRNVWYWRDIDGMVRSMLAVAPSDGITPFSLDAERGSAAPPGPQGGVTRLEIPNSHFQYAMTWYGLAVTLIGVYAAFVRSRLQRNGEGSAAST